MKAKNLLLVVLLACCLPNLTYATFAAPSPVPVERLITNIEAFIKENPQKPDGYYTLARIHYLAFANKSGIVGAFGRDDKPIRIPPDWLLSNFYVSRRYKLAEELTLKEFGYASTDDIPYDERQKFYEAKKQKRKELQEQGWVPEPLDKEQLTTHAAAALRNFKKAIELDPENALYHLGLAGLLEQYVDFLNQIDSEKVPAEFRSILLDKSRDEYHAAYRLSIGKDSRRGQKPMMGLETLVSFEAAGAYIRLAEAETSLTKDEKKKLAIVKKDLKKLENLPKYRGPITPIILSLQTNSWLDDLLAPDVRVAFDLDGTGRQQLWPWVRPTTAILVWDPDRKGRITSGRQLFGSVTWWLFFADGYRALDALDDSRDGVLAGAELASLALWFDRNSNGESEPGEVVPIEKTPILSIATKATAFDNGAPINPAGLTLNSGRTLPTYDWTPTPLK